MDTDRRYDNLRNDDDYNGENRSNRDDDDRRNFMNRDDDDRRNFMNDENRNMRSDENRSMRGDDDNRSMRGDYKKSESSSYDDAKRDYKENRNDNKHDEKVLYYLDELNDYKVASDYKDVRGWKVKDSQDRTIGEVDDLLVNKNTERVVYLDVEVDDDLAQQVSMANDRPASEGTHHFVNEDGENHVIVPIGTVDIDEDNKKVYARDIQTEKILRSKWIRKGTPIDRDYEMRTLRDYNPEGYQGDWRGDDKTFYDRSEFQQRRYRS
ncbi:MAG: PRC-barrel domain-containing protein [Chloroflexota bacterium]|jgi:hypothetical protein|nr:PRC-barrel domain-containing protein [Lentimicrobium sp.]